MYLADEVASECREEKITPPYACYAIFEQNNIPKNERDELCSQICAILGSRGGKKSGRVRRQKATQTKTRMIKMTPRRIRKMLEEARAIQLMEDARKNEMYLLASHSDP